MTLKYYVTIQELKKGGKRCKISKERPNIPYVKVLTNEKANAGRGANYVIYKNTKLSEEYRLPRREMWESLYDYMERTEPLEPTIGLLDDALVKGIELGIIK